ncbi:unnamed protein product [Rotaria magnacalcarata]|nr:unnamed protein product [Rotaria magnacalcarata]
MYIQTWHPTHQASPPVRTCSGTSGNFEIVKNKFVRFTIQTSGSTIDELTLIIFDEVSTTAICTVSAVGQDVDWMDCEQNGIKPSLIKTATHETLNVYYAKAKFTAIVTKDRTIIGMKQRLLAEHLSRDTEAIADTRQTNDHIILSNDSSDDKSYNSIIAIDKKG